MIKTNDHGGLMLQDMNGGYTGCYDADKSVIHQRDGGRDDCSSPIFCRSSNGGANLGECTVVIMRFTCLQSI